MAVRPRRQNVILKKHVNIMNTCLQKNDNDTGDNSSLTHLSCRPVRKWSPVSLFSTEEFIASVLGFHVGAKISNKFERKMTN